MILWTEDRFVTKGKNTGQPTSTARVRVQCDECKVVEWETAYCFRKVRDYDYCQSCKNKLHICGMGGKKHSEEFKRILSEKWKGNGNVVKREDVRRKISERVKGKPQPKLRGRKRPDSSKMLRERMTRVWNEDGPERQRYLDALRQSRRRLREKQHSSLHDDIRKVIVSEFSECHFESEVLIDRHTVDELCENSKIAIEIFGDYWHANPSIYSQNSIVAHGRCAKDIWQKDSNRIEQLRLRGYDVFIIWESSWKKDPTHVIERLREKLR